MAHINLVYSGGTQNAEANKSLGGFPSPVPVSEGKNNLFDDIRPQETTEGRTDYRCFYVFNDAESLRYEISPSVEYLNDSGAAVQLGFFFRDAVQSVEFPSPPTGGTFTITVQGRKSGTITWDDDQEVLASNIESALGEVTECSVEVVSGKFEITFSGVMGNKALTTISVTDNDLTPPTVPTVEHVATGSPINTVAPDVGLENLAPNGIIFYSATTPISVGHLEPSEGFPVWVKRSIDAGFEAVEGDGFILRPNASGTLG